jgi:glucuronosyltransferase
MLWILSLLLLLINSTNSANILGIFPTPSISHQVVYHALMKDLAARGYHLTILTTDLIKIDNPNVTQIDLHDSYEIFRESMNHNELQKKAAHEVMELFYETSLKFYDFQFSHPEVKKLITKAEDKKFDLLIFEHLNYLPVLAFAEVYDCPVIAIASLDFLTVIHEDFGNEVNPMIHPDFFFPFEHGKLSFAERWESLKYYLRTRFVLEPKLKVSHNEVVKKHFPNVRRSIEELKGRIQLLMTNTHPAMGYVQPLLPNTIQLGFMHIEPPKSLPDSDLKTFLDSSKNGVICMSFGSNVKSSRLSPEIQQIFLKVFGSLSYDVLWKFEFDDLPNKPDNVMISKWTPQSDLLAHPKIKLFIMQGGQQSMEEAIDRTVPMIVIPFAGDQDANAKKVKNMEIGLHLELNSLTESKLLDAINEMLKTKYKQNIIKLRELVYDQPMTSRERAVWWTEYVIRHRGAKHLEYSGRLVPFYQRFMLDFLAILSLILITLITVICFIMRKLVNFKLKTE